MRVLIIEGVLIHIHPEIPAILIIALQEIKQTNKIISSSIV